jgi:PAS domain S-box-containing protein
VPHYARGERFHYWTQPIPPLSEEMGLTHLERENPGTAITDDDSRASSQVEGDAQARLAAIVNSSDDAIISKTLDGTITSWNPAAQKIFGYTAAEAIGRPILMLFPPDRLGEELEFLDRIARGQKVEHFETVRVRKDGTPVEISVTLSPLTDARGKVIGASKIARDISERKKLDRDLRKLNAELHQRVAERTTELKQTAALQRAILNSANYAIISGLPSGVITTFNSTAEEWLGYTAAEVVGRHTPALWHDPEEVRARTELLTRELGRSIEPGFETFVAKARLGAADENEWTFIRKDGTRFPVLLSVTAITNEHGVITGFLGVIADLTERKKHEAVWRESEARFAEVFEHAPIGVALVSPVGRFLKVNRSICELVGYSEAELLSRTFQDITHPEDLEADLQNVRRMLSGTIRSYKMEKRYLHAQGHVIFVTLDVSMVRDTAGEPLYFIAQVQDVTESKHICAEREKLIAELQKALTEVKTLTGLIPICSWCKCVRDDAGYWSSVEVYLKTQANATFSHGMCPACEEKMRIEEGTRTFRVTPK